MDQNKRQKESSHKKQSTIQAAHNDAGGPGVVILNTAEPIEGTQALPSWVRLLLPYYEYIGKRRSDGKGRTRWILRCKICPNAAEKEFERAQNAASHLTVRPEYLGGQ